MNFFYYFYVLNLSLKLCTRIMVHPVQPENFYLPLYCASARIKLSTLCSFRFDAAFSCGHVHIRGVHLRLLIRWPNLLVTRPPFDLSTYASRAGQRVHTPLLLRPGSPRPLRENYVGPRSGRIASPADV